MIGHDMVYLTACALNGTTPDTARIAAMDQEKLFRMCQFHSLTAAVCMALESAGVQVSSEWTQAKSKAIRKNLLLDAERTRICTYMEENGIWHMPLKGVVLKELYPKLGMRQMSDNDILFDPAYRKQIREFMLQSGYTPEDIRKKHHDAYTKQPVYHYELHTMLFSDTSSFYTYYANIREKLLPETGKAFRLRFTDEDFYIYMIAHAYKHFREGGTGLRSLADCYIYTKTKADLDWAYIRSELKMLGITAFEQEARLLAGKVFSDPSAELNAEETKLLEYYLSSGTFGTVEQSIRNKTQTDSKLTYLRKRLFPGMEVYQESYPFFYRHKWLLPVGWAYRLARCLLFRRQQMSAEWKALRKIK